MTTALWNRDACIADIRSVLWRYVEPASSSHTEELRLAGALLGLRPEDTEQLGQLQFVLSDAVGALLRTAPTLIRTLTNSTIRHEEFTREQIRGPIMWAETYSLRAAGGGPHTWVTAPARRDYQTAENCMLATMLDAIVEAGSATDLTSRPTHADPVELIGRRVAEAEHVRQNRLLQSIERQVLSSRDVMRVRTGRARLRYEPVVAVYDAYESFIRRIDSTAVREAVAHAGLLTAPNSVLFELLTLLRTVEALHDAGWDVRPLTVADGGTQLRARMGDQRKLSLHHRHLPTRLLGATGAGASAAPAGAAASGAAGAPPSAAGGNNRHPRPDLVIRWYDADGRSRWLLIRCRLGLRTSTEVTAHQTEAELQTYAQSWPAIDSGRGAPNALGVVWGTGLDADPAASVTVCTPDRIGEAIRSIVR